MTCLNWNDILTGFKDYVLSGCMLPPLVLTTGLSKMAVLEFLVLCEAL